MPPADRQCANYFTEKTVSPACAETTIILLLNLFAAVLRLKSSTAIRCSIVIRKRNSLLCCGFCCLLLIGFKYGVFQ